MSIYRTDLTIEQLRELAEAAGTLVRKGSVKTITELFSWFSEKQTMQLTGIGERTFRRYRGNWAKADDLTLSKIRGAFGLTTTELESLLK